ncbi:unnamed protein product [Acanthoscelides obtectus]|uniref:Uncharacterized protein n=1 Tax=Acanthoscelides obtectus TaxID=200917 RepID=A0A9P0MET7_ACAOB|nr:unnamed protein product [Acanthoscelides obtectus]CAK1638900.1 hypothetical protein AOBTE_LOCUS10875 [Acanthoscelides obtectus]
MVAAVLQSRSLKVLQTFFEARPARISCKNPIKRQKKTYKMSTCRVGSF